jgi:myo-inositol-1(or 4)-monophosphatase
MKAEALQQRYDFALSLVKEAGDLAHGYFLRFEELTIMSKGHQDMASEADMNTELLIRDKLRTRFPDDGFLGEETGRAELGEHRCIWVVDPIDGTQPFTKGMSSWCVSIALVVDGVLEMGFVFAPARNELFAGRRGGAATLNGKQIKVSDASALSEGMLATGYSPRVNPEAYTVFFGKLLRDGAMFYREGSGALSLCYVACGRLIGYVELHINSWDCLGALAVIEAAGGKVSNFLEGESLWKGNRLAAGSPRLFSHILALVEAA